MRKRKSLPVFYASPVAMSLFSLGGKRLFDVNQAWLNLLEYESREEVIGSAEQEIGLKLDPHVREKVFKQPGTIKKFEATAITRSGKEIAVIVTLDTITIDRKKYVLSVIEDISGLKATESALRESETKFRRIVEGANEGIWQTDARMMTTYVNAKMAGILGYSVDEMIGKHLFDFMDEQGRSLIIKKSANCDVTKKSFGHKYLKKDGTFLHALVSSTHLYDEAGNFEGSIGMVTDISERIDVEKALRKTRRKLEMALQNGKIGILEWNFKTGEVVYDERTENMFGLKPGSYCKPASVFGSQIHEEDLAHVRDAYQKSLKNNQPLETIFRTKRNGNANYISLKGFISKDRKGHPSMLTGVCFDVTEMKNDAEQGLLRLTEELLRSNNDLKQFAYIASHDLQEPLRMVSSFTQLLQQRYSSLLDEDGQEFIRYAVDGSKRMYDLLNGLLAYSRIQTRGKEFTAVDMNEIISIVKCGLRLVINETDCTITCQRLPVINGDSSQMIQLIQNLVENGIKFSCGKPEISISSSRNNGFHLFSVKDCGIGIEEQYFEKIFRIFQRLHRSDEYKGTGIGLAICKRIVERHGGTIWVTSVPGKGSTFWFTIPIKA
ncbi:MAG: PAS domain S-box protein [Chloroflexota bacterium]